MSTLFVRSVDQQHSPHTLVDIQTIAWSAIERLVALYHVCDGCPPRISALQTTRLRRFFRYTRGVGQLGFQRGGSRYRINEHRLRPMAMRVVGAGPCGSTRPPLGNPNADLSRADILPCGLRCPHGGLVAWVHGAHASFTSPIPSAWSSEPTLGLTLTCAS